MGVNDPVKVTRTALQSAASVAALILITEATINDPASNLIDARLPACSMAEWEQALPRKTVSWLNRTTN